MVKLNLRRDDFSEKKFNSRSQCHRYLFINLYPNNAVMVKFCVDNNMKRVVNFLRLYIYIHKITRGENT